MKLKTESIQLLPDESFRLLSWQNDIHAVDVVAPDGAHRPITGAGHEWHHHPQLELTLVSTGAGTRFIGDSIAHFRAPDLVLIGPDLPHYWHMRQRSSGFALQFDFGDTHPFWHFPETRELRALWEEARHGIHITGPDAAVLARLIRTAAACGGLERLTRLLQILNAILRLPPKDRHPVSRTVFTPPARQSTTLSLQRAINFVFSTFQEPLCFSDVLAKAHMSKATFERHFKRHTGMTFTQFVAEVRLNYACRQLAETDTPVGEIALASGFGNLSHFNHLFRLMRGVAPRDFRSGLRGRISPSERR